MRTRWTVSLVFLVLLAAGCGGEQKEPPLTVRVTNGASGEPVAGAEVKWIFADVDPTSGQYSRADEQAGTSDAEGKTIFTSLPESRAGKQEIFAIEINAAGYATSSHVDSFAFDAGRGMTVNFGILPEWGKSQVEGAVRDVATLAPVPDVAVTATATQREDSPAAASGDERFPQQKTFEATTGEDGRFVIPMEYYALDRESYWLVVQGKRDGWRYALYNMGALRGGRGRNISVNYARLGCDLFLVKEDDQISVHGEAHMPSGDPPPAGLSLTLRGVDFVGTCERGCHGGEPRPGQTIPITLDADGDFDAEIWARFAYCLAGGIEIRWGDESLIWRNSLAYGQKSAQGTLTFPDGSTVALDVAFVADRTASLR
jgi:hypothetical protein